MNLTEHHILVGGSTFPRICRAVYHCVDVTGNYQYVDQHPSLVGRLDQCVYVGLVVFNTTFWAPIMGEFQYDALISDAEKRGLTEVDISFLRTAIANRKINPETLEWVEYSKT